nr:retron system putative HNH endonuclease [Microcoleus sp. FACHB-68]
MAKWKARANEDWTPIYKDLRGTPKTELHESLLREQGYICCYCGNSINDKDSHIEHFKPQTTYPDLTLEYTNLLASCQREGKKSEPVHCGPKKAYWYDEQLMISPLEPNCADFFTYSGSGEILPATDPDKQAAAKETIDKLGLDIDKLRAERIQAIEGFLQAIKGLTDEEIQQFAQAYEKLDVKGKYAPFATVIAYFYKKYFTGTT